MDIVDVVVGIGVGVGVGVGVDEDVGIATGIVDGDEDVVVDVGVGAEWGIVGECFDCAKQDATFLAAQLRYIFDKTKRTSTFYNSLFDISYRFSRSSSSAAPIVFSFFVLPNILPVRHALLFLHEELPCSA
jgi:hypothetical protein